MNDYPTYWCLHQGGPLHHLTVTAVDAPEALRKVRDARPGAVLYVISPNTVAASSSSGEGVA